MRRNQIKCAISGEIAVLVIPRGKVPKLPRAVEKLVGTGKPGCPVCGGVGVRVLACLTGAAYRPCVCTERTRIAA